MANLSVPLDMYFKNAYLSAAGNSKPAVTVQTASPPTTDHNQVHTSTSVQENVKHIYGSNDANGINNTEHTKDDTDMQLDIEQQIIVHPAAALSTTTEHATKHVTPPKSIGTVSRNSKLNDYAMPNAIMQRFKNGI